MKAKTYQVKGFTAVVLLLLDCLGTPLISLVESVPLVLWTREE